MRGSNRTRRISIRCSPEEIANVGAMAARYQLDVASFIRQAIVIAQAQAATPRAWQNAYYRAVEIATEELPWKNL